jgi:hypothetical protein
VDIGFISYSNASTLQQLILPQVGPEQGAFSGFLTIFLTS